MSTRSNKPSFTEIRKVLASCAFDPRKPGPMAVVADSATPEYATRRSMEFLREAATIDPFGPAADQWLTNVQRAISLLGFSIANIERTSRENKKAKSKPKRAAPNPADGKLDQGSQQQQNSDSGRGQYGL